MNTLFKNKSFFFWALLPVAFFYIINNIFLLIKPFDRELLWVQSTPAYLAHLSVALFLLLVVFFNKDKSLRFGLMFFVGIFAYAGLSEDVIILFAGILGILSLTTIRFFKKKAKEKPDYMQYGFTVLLCLIYYFYKLNLGNKFIIETSHVISALGFLALAYVCVRHFLPETKYIKNELNVKKVTLKGFGIGILVLILSLSGSILFDVFCSYRIVNYKFNRYCDMQIAGFYDNRLQYESVVKQIDALPMILFVEFEYGELSFNIYADSTGTTDFFDYYNSYGGTYIEYDGEERGVSDISFLSNNSILYTYSGSDTTFICTANWQLHTKKMKNNDIVLTKIIDYLGIDRDVLKSVVTQLQLLDCVAFMKDKSGNIYIFKRVDIEQNSGFAFVKTGLPEQIKNGLYRELDDSVYWVNYETCGVDFFYSDYINRYNI